MNTFKASNHQYNIKNMDPLKRGNTFERIFLPSKSNPSSLRKHMIIIALIIPTPKNTPK
jgi:hypothetical protein